MGRRSCKRGARVHYRSRHRWGMRSLTSADGTVGTVIGLGAGVADALRASAGIPESSDRVRMLLMPAPVNLSRRFLLEAASTVSVLLGTSIPSPSMNLAGSDPLPSWNEGLTKKQIIDFVSNVTRAGSTTFVHPEDRTLLLTTMEGYGSNTPCTCNWHVRSTA